jgi:serine phosphatase RsbU (regulator of sigma subunit)
VGRNCRFLQGEETDAAAVEEIRRSLDSGRECVVELKNYRASGEPFWNRLSITPIRNEEGVVTHFIGIQSDVTARRRAEEGLRSANTMLEEANRRISRDLDLAADIQKGFLPPEHIDIEDMEIAWHLQPCAELAGDTLNVVPLDGGEVEIYSIDVSGHGAPAALLSVTLNHLLAPASGRLVLSGPTPRDIVANDILPPAEVAGTLSRQFPYDPDRNQYFTMSYGLYNTRSRLFRFVSAGHPPPVYIPRAGEAQMDWIQGLPIGIDPDFGYEQNTIELAPGDRVYIFSDGLIEVFDEADEPYGLERLKATLGDLRDESLKQSIHSVTSRVEEWGHGAPFQDDVSIIAFEAR